MVGPKIPMDIYVAASGGPDSMAVLDFLIRGGRKITVLHFDHGTKHGEDAREFIREYCQSRDIKLIIGNEIRERDSNESMEEYWRDMRYQFLDQYSDKPIVMAHNLDDQVMSWVFTSLNGLPKLIPYNRRNVIRPFIVTSKQNMIDWCERNGVPYLTDPSNDDTRYMRNFIRKEILPSALVVNPGLYKVILKKILRNFEG